MIPRDAEVNDLPEQSWFFFLGLLDPPRLFLDPLFEFFSSRACIVGRCHPDTSQLLPIFHNRLSISSSSRRMLCFTSRNESSSARSSRLRATPKPS